jgi:hypothetical protein
MYLKPKKYKIYFNKILFKDWLQSEIIDMETYYSTKYLSEEEIIKGISYITNIL